MHPETPELHPEAILAQAAFVRALARGLVSGDLEAEDLAQETLVKALERPPRQPGALRAWLGRVAFCLAWKARRRDLRRERRELLSAPPAPAPSPVEILACQEELLAVGSAVRALPDSMRIAVHLRYFEGLGPTAIAERLGEPVETVKSRLKRALARLRELLDESHGGDRKRWLAGLAPLLALDAPGAIVAGAAAGTAGTTMLLGGIAMKKLLLAAAGVLLLVLLLVNLQAPPPGLQGTPASQPPGPLAAIASPPSETQPEEPRKPVGAPEAAPAFHPQPADGWLVEVVRRRKDFPGGEAFEPVPDATVRVVGWEEVSNQVLGHWLSMEHAANLSMRDAAWILSHDDRNLGRSYLADSRGQVRIPQVGDPSLLLLGRHQGKRGSLIFQPGRFPPFRLELQPDAVLRVHVVDQKGRPLAGVPVHLQFSPNTRMPRTISPPFETAGPEGVVEIHGIQKAVETTNPRLFVFLGVPLATPIFAEIDPGALPTEPVRLVLPPTGSVRLDLPGPSLKEKEFLLARLGRTKDPSWEMIDGAFLQPMGTGIPLARAQGGQIRFPYVGLGLELEIRVLRYSSAIYSEGGQLTRVGFGPTAPGQEVVFRFEDPPTIPVFSGRIVDQRGEPVARRWFSFAVEGQPSNLEKQLSNIEGKIKLPITDSSMGMTDGTGRFLRPIPSNPVNDPLALRVTETGGAHEPSLSGSRQFPTPIPDTGFDIGDVQVRPLPLLAAGTVVDEEERPIPGAALMALFPMGPRVAFPIQTRTDAEGRFRLYATLRAGEIEVMVVMIGYDRARQTIATGASEIRLVLRRAAGYLGVEGSVILPEGAPPEQFYALLKDPGPNGNARHLPIDADGRFSFKGMNHEEGLKDLSIHLDFFPGGKLLQVDGISLEKGRVNRDPRLQQIDLGRLVQAVELEVVDAHGAPIPRAKVAVKSSDGPFRDLLKFRSYLLPQGGHELRVSAAGFRPTVFQVPPLRRQVVLQRGLDVRLRLEPPLPPREAGILVAFALEGPGLDFQGEEAEEPAGGFRFCLHGPGRHEVTARLSLTANGSTGSRSFRVTDPAWIEVEEQAGTQIFPLRLDLAALRRAMEEMKAAAR